MKRILIIVMMALLVVGSADAQKKNRKRTRATARTTATTKAKAPAVTPIGEPQLVFDMNQLTNRAQNVYKKALEGDAESQCRVALLLCIGEDGFPKNKPEALRWYYLAAKQGYRERGYCEACYEIGEAYSFPSLWDDCVKQNEFEAAKWYAKAATVKGKENIGQRFDKDAERAFNSLKSLLKYDRITLAQYEIAKQEALAEGGGSSFLLNTISKEAGEEAQVKEVLSKFTGIWTCSSALSDFKFDSNGNAWFRNGSGRAWETLGVKYVSYNCIKVYDANRWHKLEFSGSTMTLNGTYVYRRSR